jgi:hypothetical protein
MKTPHHHNRDNSRRLDRPHRKPPPHPALRDEHFEPYFRSDRADRPAVSSDSANDGNAPDGSYDPRIPVVRVISALAIIAIIVALMVFA